MSTKNTIDEISQILNDMLTRMAINKHMPKEVVLRSTFSVKCYWCGDVLRYDIQLKELGNGAK